MMLSSFRLQQNFRRNKSLLSTLNKCLDFTAVIPCTFSSKNFASSSEVKASEPTTSEISDIAEKIPIEKRSLARGLSINEFEKDFMIYPEYEHNREHERIKAFVQKLSGELEQAYRSLKIEGGTALTTGNLPTKIRNILAQSKVFTATIQAEFGGLNFCQKDLLQLSESLGQQDLSLFQTFNNVALGANVIAQFGTKEQKHRYLPGIGTGQWRPAVCIRDETSGTKPADHIFAAKGQQEFLSAVKIDVENARDANLFIVFANRKVGDMIIPACYLIERDNIIEGVSHITVKDQIHTGGLQQCNFSTVVFDNVPLMDCMHLGTEDNAGYLVDELSINGKTLYGAAVIGYLKKTLGNLCNFANQQVKGNLRLSDSHPIQHAITELGLITYVVESIVYYIGGLVDEELFVMQDVENAIIQRMCNRAIRQSIMTITEVAGLAATNTELEYEQTMRDSIALMSLSEPELHLVRRVALPSIEAYVSKYGGLKSFMDTMTVTKRLRGLDTYDFVNPELIHFIGEHVHQSLEPAARELEYSMSRLGHLIDRLTSEKGVYINTDYISLNNICTVMENLLSMTATIARSSRSYSIGLRGAENEVEWTCYYCAKVSEENKRIIKEAVERHGMLKFNPRLTEIGQDLLQSNGYFPESPLEKNW